MCIYYDPLIGEDEDNRCVSCSHQACSALGYKLISSQLLWFSCKQLHILYQLLGRSEVLRSLRHYLQVQSKDITPLITWRREAWKEEELDDLP